MTTADRITLAAVLVAAVLAGAAAWTVLSTLPPAAGPADGVAFESPPPASEAGEASSELVVDVEGGVLAPGVHRLPAGARVGDAIVAAGGYAPDADLVAAAHSLNLAAPLVDGQQVYVPLLGEGATASRPGDGLVNLNLASAEELDTLPGIGPVTVGKIVAAREERLFGSLDELVERDVLTQGQLDRIRDLVTVG